MSMYNCIYAIVRVFSKRVAFATNTEIIAFSSGSRRRPFKVRGLRIDTEAISFLYFNFSD